VESLLPPSEPAPEDFPVIVYAEHPLLVSAPAAVKFVSSLKVKPLHCVLHTKTWPYPPVSDRAFAIKHWFWSHLWISWICLSQLHYNIICNSQICFNVCDSLQLLPWSLKDPVHSIITEVNPEAAQESLNDPTRHTKPPPESTSCTSHWTPANTENERGPWRTTCWQVTWWQCGTAESPRVCGTAILWELSLLFRTYKRLWNKGMMHLSVKFPDLPFQHEWRWYGCVSTYVLNFLFYCHITALLGEHCDIYKVLAVYLS
jgi:hypothetical protein